MRVCGCLRTTASNTRAASGTTSLFTMRGTAMPSSTQTPRKIQGCSTRSCSSWPQSISIFKSDGIMLILMDAEVLGGEPSASAAAKAGGDQAHAATAAGNAAAAAAAVEARRGYGVNKRNASVCSEQHSCEPAALQEMLCGCRLLCWPLRVAVEQRKQGVLPQRTPTVCMATALYRYCKPVLDTIQMTYILSRM